MSNIDQTIRLVFLYILMITAIGYATLGAVKTVTALGKYATDGYQQPPTYPTTSSWSSGDDQSKLIEYDKTYESYNKKQVKILFTEDLTKGLSMLIFGLIVAYFSNSAVKKT